jgi:hypothetical protein
MHNGFDDLDLDRLRRRRSEKWRLHPPDVLPAFIAEMDYDLAEPVAAALRAAVDRSDCGYPTLDGIGETFAAFAAARHGWTVDPGRVHLVPDVMAGFDAIVALATEPGDGVVINPPVYPPFFQHIGFARRRVAEVPLVREGGRWELDFAGLEAAFAAGARAYLLCNPHNPTGRVFSTADLDRIGSLAEQYGVLVLADEIHAPLTLPGARHTPFVSLGGAAAEHGVTLASASKAFNVAGLKGAVAVAGLFLAAACVFGLVNKLGLLVVFLAGMIVFGLGLAVALLGLAVASDAQSAPAASDVVGTWTGVAGQAATSVPVTLTLNQNGTNATGNLTVAARPDLSGPVTGAIQGEVLKLSLATTTFSQLIVKGDQMTGMTDVETKSYLAHHLKLAGRADTLFSDDAITLIHDTSRGLPRTVNNLCVASLIAACAAGHAIADQAAARSAITEVTATP